MSTTILIALLALIFFGQIFTWRAALDASADARNAAVQAGTALGCAQVTTRAVHELTSDGSPLMRAIAALPRKRSKKGSST